MPRVLAATLLGALVGGCANNPHPPEWTREDTYFYSIGAEPTSFDPSISYNGGDAVIMDLIYPSYFRYHPLKQEPWEFELNVGLVEPKREPFAGRTSAEEGGKPFRGERWTFELRHDLRFQDDPCFPGGRGRAVTARDMEYTFKRLVNPKVPFPLEQNLADKVVGWGDYRKAFASLGEANYEKPFAGFQRDPKNPYRFSLLLNQAYPQLRFIMAMHFTTPVAREAVDRYGDAFALFHPVGCGPYKLQEYTPHKRVVLVPNPNNRHERFPTSGAPGLPKHLLADAGRPLPLTKRIVFRIITEPVTSYNLFDQGYLDSAGIGATNSQLLLPAIRPGAKMVERGVELQQGAYPAVEYGAFNMKDPTFGGYTPQKRKLRQAISLAIDSETYIDQIYHGMAKRLESFLPHGLGGFDPTYQNPYRRYEPRLRKAKALLAEAGYPNGVEAKTGERLTLNFDTYIASPADRARVRLLSKQIQALGVRVVTRDTNYPAFMEKTTRGKTQFFTWGWFADYPDAENFAFLLYGPNAAPGPNSALYANPEYDRLFEQMRPMDDSPKRAAVIRKMRDIVVEDCPWIYLCENEAPSVFQPWVRNKISNPIVIDIPKYRAVDAQKRVALQQRWNQPMVGPFLVFLLVTVLAAVPAVLTVRRQRSRRVLRPAPPEKDRE